jgi:Domain of unknown function (DU1801)
MTAPPNIKTPEQYFASLAEPRRSDVRALHEAICKAIPKHRPEMIGGFLGYGKHRYKYESGREGDTGVVMLASQKQYISLYLGCGESGWLAEKNKARLGKVSTGKCCIRFKKLADLNLKVAMELVKETGKQVGAAAKKSA